MMSFLTNICLYMSGVYVMYIFSH